MDVHTKVLITGATDGIGKATALRLAEIGFRLVMHGRNPEKLKAAAAQVAAVSKTPPETVLADFASLQEVAMLAEAVTEKHADLAILINNAGLLTDHRQESRDGYELTWAVNYLAPVLLTERLLPVLQQNAPARIINVASTAMGGGYISFDDLQFHQGFDGWQAYANSKLANVVYSDTLAARLAGTSVVTNALCPGLIDTNFFHTNTVFANGMYERMQPGMRTPEQGADIPVYLATEPELADVSGRFFMRSREPGMNGQIQGLMTRQDAELMQGLNEVTRSTLATYL